MARQTPQLSHGIDTLVRSGLDVDPSRCRFQQIHNVVLHARLERRNLGAFQNQRDIDIPDFVPVPVHDLIGVFHELAGITSLPPGIRVLKDLSDIRQCQGTENGVDDRVVNDVSIAMGDDSQLGLVDSTLLDVLALGICPL